MLARYEYSMDKPVKHSWDSFFDGDALEHVFECLVPGSFTTKKSVHTLHGSDRYRTRSDADCMTLEVDLPGIAPSDVEVSTQGDVITVAWKRASRGGTQRYTIASDYDTALTTASMRDGMLTVKIMRSAVNALRKIPIKVE